MSHHYQPLVLPDRYELTTFEQLVEIAQSIGNVTIPNTRNRKILFDRIQKAQLSKPKLQLSNVTLRTPTSPSNSSLTMKQYNPVTITQTPSTRDKSRPLLDYRSSTSLTVVPKPKIQRSNKYYYQTVDGKYIESTRSVDLDWLSMNLSKQCILTDTKPKNIDYRVVEPDNKVHWVAVIQKVA